MSSESPTVVGPEALATVRPRVTQLENAATAADGHPSLNDGVWRDLADPHPDSAGFFVDDAAFAHVARAGANGTTAWSVGVVVAPAARATSARPHALAAAVEHIHTRGGGRADLWLLGATDADDDDLARAGFVPDRGLYEMRVRLPLRERPKVRPGITLRTFEPGRDDDAWLAVNNRAFARHAEQGGWTRDTLDRRRREAWFDPTLFFLAFDADGLAGFNWCKIHEPHASDPAIGEIYVIGVDPRMQGSGLGRALAIIGLDAVFERGITTGSLFVAADNAGAIHLYRALGFTEHRVDRAYVAEVEAS